MEQSLTKKLVKDNKQNAQRGGAAGKCLKKGIDFSRGHRYDNSVHTTDGSGITTWSMNRCFADRLGIVYAWKGGFFMQKFAFSAFKNTYLTEKRRNDHG